MIPESFIQELLARVDIVDLIDAQVPLKKAGANFVACCPFHAERTPSFTVSPSKQFYHCFGCGAHGTAIGFLMEHSGLGFVDAIKDLAARAGMQLPEGEADTPRGDQGTGDLITVMARAGRYFREQLKRSAVAIDYLKRRGLTGEIAAHFGIGYAPDGWQSLAEPFPNYESPTLQSAGLVIRNDQGRVYDRFRDRVMFPIFSQKGDIIAFGGRVIGDGEPKYLNSPETPLFEKGRELFGLPQARAALRETNTAIVVEGYMDVVALAQHGVGNAVATLGTATTPIHVQKLLRLVDRVVFCFDGDSAGRRAAWRALENAIGSATDTKLLAFAFLPGEHDPDSYVRDVGPDRFRELIAHALPLSEYLAQELSQRNDLASAEGRARCLSEAKPLLSRLGSAPLRLQMVKRLAQATGNTPAEVERSCELRPIASPPPPRRAPRPPPASPWQEIARDILQSPALAPNFPRELLPTSDPEADAFRELLAACQDASREGAGTAALSERLRHSPHSTWIQRTFESLLKNPIDVEEAAIDFKDWIERLRQQRLDEWKTLQDKARAGTITAEEKLRYGELSRTQTRIGVRNRTS